MSLPVGRFFPMLALVIGLGTGTAAYADTTYQVTLTGVGLNGFLNLDATPDGVGTFLVTSISGAINGNAITGEIAPTNSGPFSTDIVGHVGNLTYSFQYDDLIFPSSNPSLDVYGLLFNVQGQTSPANLFYNPPYLYSVFNGAGFTDTPVSLSIVATPEPSSVLLCLAGLAVLAAAMSRKLLG
jgi:hypothetical protein